MKQSRFLQRLHYELPIWVNKGWVLPSNQQNILEYVAKQEQQTQTSSTSIFALFGVLLFATGVISFFAANWGIIPKILKLVMLFSAMWAAYVLAYLGFSTKQYNPDSTLSAIPVISKFRSVFLILAVLLFGANIWLIAQIYNIQAFYPTGVLAWSLAALLTAVLLKDELTLALSMVLAVVWTCLDFSVLNFRGQIHWAFLFLWAIQLYFIFRFKRTALFNLSILGLVIWSLLSLSIIDFNLYFFQLYFLLSCFLIFIGSLFATLSRFKRYKPCSVSLKHWGLFLAFSALYFLAIPALLRITDDHLKFISDFYPVPINIGFGLTLSIMLLNLGILFVLWNINRTQSSHIPTLYAPVQLRIYSGLSLYFILNIIMLITFYHNFLKNHLGIISFIFNFIFFIGTLWLVQIGNQMKDSFYINLGCFFFAIGLLTRYFDTFWTLLDRSFFFMFGGLLLIVGSYLIEKYRRYNIRNIQDSNSDELRP